MIMMTLFVNNHDFVVNNEALFLTVYIHDCIFWPVGLEYIFYMLHIYNLVGLLNDKCAYKMTSYDPGGTVSY